MCELVEGIVTVPRIRPTPRPGAPRPFKDGDAGLLRNEGSATQPLRVPCPRSRAVHTKGHPQKRTVPFSVLGVVARAVVHVIVRTVSQAQNCPIWGRTPNGTVLSEVRCPRAAPPDGVAWG